MHGFLIPDHMCLMLHIIPQEVIESLKERIRELESEVNSEGIQQLKEEKKVGRYTIIEANMYCRMIMMIGTSR